MDKTKVSIEDLEKRNKVLERRWKIALVLAILFVVTRPVALFVVNHFIHKAAQTATRNEYPLVDPARQFISQDDYLINIDHLRTYLNSFSNKSISIYYEQLNSGANISVNKDLRLWPASLTKLPVALVVMKKIESGGWSEDTTLTLADTDKDPGSGDLYKNPDGSKFTVSDLLEQLLVNSDNTAERMLTRSLSDQELKTLIDETGLEDVFDAQGLASAKEYTRLFRVLYTSSYLKRAQSEKILELLSKAAPGQYLGAGLPEGTAYAHKFGENVKHDVVGDSGIVYQGNRPYMLTVIIQTDDNSEQSHQKALDLMKEISQKAYEAGK
jgi:beta-lactamase class A